MKNFRNRHTDTDLHFNIDDTMSIHEEEDNYQEPAEWTIISALDRVLSKAEDSRLCAKFWKAVKSPIAYLTKELGLSDIQVVFIAILIESGEAMSWRDIGQFLNCSRISVMVHSEEMDGLLEKRWVVRRGTWQMGSCYEGFALVRGVVTALRRNTVFVPERLDCLDIQDFVGKLEAHLDNNLDGNNTPFDAVESWMMQLCKANPQLPLCQVVEQYKDDIHTQSLLLLVIYDYAQWAESEKEGLCLSSINHWYPNDCDSNIRHRQLIDGEHRLIIDGYIEHKCEDGVADTERYSLTRKCKEELLADYVPSRKNCPSRNNGKRHLKSHETIKAKNMFYNAEEQQQIERLTSLLSQESLPGIQERLSNEGMRQGVACLFFGTPGTGKTETVLQIARQTGRDIMQIDIAGMRDKYVGESEKNIKAVFARYKSVCKQSEVMPILLFNEADAIFGKRTAIGGTNPSVEKMDNAIQNIILQEMEDLEGILIATTNLTCNLDSAFERRFLFKIEFHNPNNEVRAKLWSSMLGNSITMEEAHKLAARYNFSGGQIENIARQRTIEYILSGKQIGFNEIDEFCKHELINKQATARKPIGF